MAPNANVSVFLFFSPFSPLSLGGHLCIMICGSKTWEISIRINILERGREREEKNLPSLSLKKTCQELFLMDIQVERNTVHKWTIFFLKKAKYATRPFPEKFVFFSTINYPQTRKVPFFPTNCWETSQGSSSHMMKLRFFFHRTMNTRGGFFLFLLLLLLFFPPLCVSSLCAVCAVKRV